MFGSPVLAHYCEELLKRPSPAVRMQNESFLDPAEVVNEISRSLIKLVPTAALLCLVTKHIKDYKATFGEEMATLNFTCLPIFANFCPNTSRFVVHGRKHKSIKRYANQVFDTSGDWDASVSREVTSGRLERMAASGPTMFSESAGLVQLRAPSLKMMRWIIGVLGDGFAAATTMTSRTARADKYEYSTIGDLALVGHTDPPVTGRVVFHISIQVDELVECASLIDEYEVTEVQNREWKCKLAGRQTLFEMSDIVCFLAYAGTDVVTVLKPIHAVAHPGL